MQPIKTQLSCRILAGITPNLPIVLCTSCHIALVTIFSIASYKIVMQHLLVVYYEPHKSLVLSSDSEMLGCARYNVTPFKKSINVLLITGILQYNQHFGCFSAKLLYQGF